MLDLIRLSRRPPFPPGGRELFRHIALITGLEKGQEVVVAACGPGVTAEYFAREFGAHVSAVDEDPELVERVEARARAGGFHSTLQVQRAPMDDLPYRDGVFDVAVGEIGLMARADPAAAIHELARVVKPGGRIALVQPVWKAPVDRERREVLGRHLGVRILMVVEVKRMLKDAGIGQLLTEAWSDGTGAFRRNRHTAFPDFAELFSITERLAILRRAWRRWGLRGVRVALAREGEVHRLLTRERILGLDLVTGRKPDGEGDASESDAGTGPEPPSGPRAEEENE